jgi:hypothetical protein
MALKKEDIATLAVLAKLTPEELTKAITDANEVALTIPEKLQVFTEAELNIYQKNKYEDGRTAGIEKAVKDARDKLGLDFTGKTIDGLLDAATKKALADADKNPDARLQEANKKIEFLQANVTKFESQAAEKEAALNSLKDSYETARYIPNPTENGVQYTPDVVLAHAKMAGYDFKRNSDGVMQGFINGQLVQDKLGNAIPVKDVITGFMKETKYITDQVEDTPGGRGGKDKPGGGGGVSKMAQLRAKWEAEGKSIQGEDFAKEVEKMAAADPTFDPRA